ncbi:DUF6343 family protein [Kitasatospora camelliae]|uniref:DUF6343 family protein n=1 Tax=Kitasatospora camelliae TaxID=3156397 RepID=A0AAU8JSV6_9ACTN
MNKRRGSGVPPDGPGGTSGFDDGQGPVPEWRTDRRGTEPANARSDLELRRLLSLVFLVLFLCGTALFAVLAALAGPGPAPNQDTYVVFAAVCTGFAGIAALDLMVIHRRLAAGQGRRRLPPPHH